MIPAWLVLATLPTPPEQVYDPPETRQATSVLDETLDPGLSWTSSTLPRMTWHMTADCRINEAFIQRLELAGLASKQEDVSFAVRVRSHAHPKGTRFSATITQQRRGQQSLREVAPASCELLREESFEVIRSLLEATTPAETNEAEAEPESESESEALPTPQPTKNPEPPGLERALQTRLQFELGTALGPFPVTTYVTAVRGELDGGRHAAVLGLRYGFGPHTIDPPGSGGIAQVTRYYHQGVVTARYCLHAIDRAKFVLPICLGAEAGIVAAPPAADFHVPLTAAGEREFRSNGFWWAGTAGLQLRLSSSKGAPAFAIGFESWFTVPECCIDLDNNFDPDPGPDPQSSHVVKNKGIGLRGFVEISFLVAEKTRGRAMAPKLRSDRPPRDR